MAEVQVESLPNELHALGTLVDERPESLAAGSSDIQLAALRATKFLYDLALKSESQSRGHIAELLKSISPNLAPQTRSQSSASSKRKRDPSPDSAHDGPQMHETPLGELFVDGMNDDQLWAQLELRAKNVCDVLDYALDGAGEQMGNDDDDDTAELNIKKEMLGEDFDMDDLEGIMDSEDDDEDDSDMDEEKDSEDSAEDDQDEEGEENADEDLGEAVVQLHDPSDEDDSEEDIDLDKPSILSLNSGKRPTRRKAKAGGHPELDDGFFDLAAFNAEIEEAESRTVSKGRLGEGDSDEEDEEDEEPLDLFAPVDPSAAAFDEEDLEGGPTEPFYKDFFDPPPHVASSKGKDKSRAIDDVHSGKVRFHEEVRVKKIKAKGRNLPTSMMYEEEDDDDDDEDDYGELMQDGESEEEAADDFDQNGEEDTSLGFESLDEDEEDVDQGGRATMERFKDDLFAKEEKEQTDMSTYEKRMAALREEIAALEAENVAKKDWTLMGEATSRSRPQNSLLEEDLEYERVMKSVPVITEETVHSLEERIKARILESQYDDVVRKRPVDDKPFLPSRFFELQDTKSKQSLAEIYEDEYTAAQTGGVAGEDRDGKLKKEHQEIEKLWETITGKLDTLCNAHFTPKAATASISTVANVAAASMESALPTTMSTSSMLAPEEVFAPPTANDLHARSELTPTEKRALRNKQKKAKKKARDVLEKSVDKFAKSKRTGSVKKQKEAALKSVVKSGKGVTVVGKKSKEVTGKRTRSTS